MNSLQKFSADGLTCDCPLDAECYDTRASKGYRRRRYKCPGCGKRWTSVEIVVQGGSKGAGKALKALKRQLLEAELTWVLETLKAHWGHK